MRKASDIAKDVIENYKTKVGPLSKKERECVDWILDLVTIGINTAQEEFVDDLLIERVRLQMSLGLMSDETFH